MSGPDVQAERDYYRELCASHQAEIAELRKQLAAAQHSLEELHLTEPAQESDVQTP